MEDLRFTSGLPCRGHVVVVVWCVVQLRKGQGRAAWSGVVWCGVVVGGRRFDERTVVSQEGVFKKSSITEFFL